MSVNGRVLLPVAIPKLWMASFDRIPRCCWKPCIRFISTHGRRDRTRTKGDHYSTLKISPKASPSQIKTAYYRLSLIYHPDRNKDSSESKEKFAAISEAYQVLSDKSKRQAYDRSLASHTTRLVFHEDVLRRHRKSNLKYKDGYDEWTRAHYGNAFQKSQRLAQDRIEILRRMKTEKELFNKKIYTVVAFLVPFFIIISGFHF